jgi:hypothetical protein
MSDRLVAMPPETKLVLDELAQTLDRETGIVRDLIAALADQRQGVATSDLALINGSIERMGRTLLTLREARDRRAALVSRLVPEGDVPLEGLTARLGHPPSEELERARERLRRAAEDAVRETNINRAVLRRVVAAGEAFLQELFSSGSEPLPVYTAQESRPDAAATPPTVINRRA